MVSNANAAKKVEENLTVDRRNKFSARCTWTIPDVKGKIKQKAVWSKYFDVGGYDCRLLLYPGGDSQALPGYISVYLQITDPATTNAKWECFTSYRLCIENQVDSEKSVSRDSWHRFSPKKKSHGWCDFTPSATILDGKSGFCVSDSIVVSADILLLQEEYSFQRDPEPGNGTPGAGMHSDVLAGKFTWKVHNISMFMEVMSMQKIMSPVFPAGGCQLRLSVYQSTVNDVEYLSMCLESKDADKSPASDKSCWCLFRMSVISHKEKGGSHMLRDSYGRFASDARTGDNTSLGWNDYMPISDFFDAAQAYVSPEGTAVFTTSFHIIKESSSFVRLPLERLLGGGGKRGKGGGGSDGFQGKFTWKIENFTKLKDLLKKRKITSLCIKSRRFQVGGKDCRLIVYPRGQSQPPMHLSMFLEVTDSRNQEADWSCFVSHRLSVVNQNKDSDKSVSKESQNRYSKAAKDWGWREFVTLTSLFDTDLGFLVNDTVVLCAEVLILKEACDVRLVPLSHDSAKAPALAHGAQAMDSCVLCPQIPLGNKLTFTWKIDNFLAFKEILETRKIFSKFFTVGGCDLRIGVYESFDTLCIYLESEAQSAGDPQEGSFWVQYRIAAVSQRKPELTEWKESSICTRAWNNSVLQFIKVPDMLNSEKGYFVKDSIVLACDILECTPWLEFGDTDLTFSEPDTDAAPVAPPLPWPLDADEPEATAAADGSAAPVGGAAVAAGTAAVAAAAPPTGAPAAGSKGLPPAAPAAAAAAGKDSAIARLLGQAGLQLSTVPQPESMAAPLGSMAAAAGATVHIQALLQKKLSEDEELLQSFCKGMRAYLQDPAWVHRLARTTVTTSSASSAEALEAAPSLLELLLSVHILQQPLLDLMVSVLLSACEEHATALAQGPKPAASTVTPPPLTSAGHAAALMRRAGGAALAAKWDAICGLPQARNPQPAASEAVATAAAAAAAATADAAELDGGPRGGAGRGAAPAAAPAATGQWSPAALFALMQPHRFITHFHALAPTMILSSGPPSPAEVAAGAVDTKQHIRELVAMIASVIKTADPWTLAAERSANAALGIPAPTAENMRRIMLLAPPELLPYLAMAVPVVLDPGQHTMAAGVLLAALADASHMSPEAEAELQMPVCAAIGMFQIAQPIAAPALKEAVASLPTLPQRELPGAIALVAKLANEVPGGAPLAMHTIRDRIAALGHTVPLCVLQALCLAVIQHHEVASAILQDISDMATSVKTAVPPVPESPAPASAAPRPVDANGATCADSDTPPVATPPQPPQHQHLMEIELLIEIMLMPHLRDDAETIFEACVSKGLITAESTALLLERRRMQHIMFRKLAAQMPHQDAAAHTLWRHHLASVLSWPKASAAAGAAAAAPASSAGVVGGAGAAAAARRLAAAAGVGAVGGSAATSTTVTSPSPPLVARHADGITPPAAVDTTPAGPPPAAAPDVPFRFAQTTAAAGIAANMAAGGGLWPPATLPTPPASPEASGMDDDDFNVLLDLAAWLSHTASPSPATQQFTFRLYLHIFSLWPGHQGRVRMIQALAHRSQSFATIASHTDPGQMLLPVQAGSIESRVLICLAEEWPQYAPVALLCLLDLLGKQGNAYGIQCMQKQAQADELAKVQEEFTATKATLATEKQAAKDRIAELERQMATAAEEGEQRRSDLSDEVHALHASVVRLESDLRQARQAGDAAENRVTAAQKDLRAMAALEDEARRLRSQLQAADKRRARDSKALKDTEARAAAVETRLAERNSHLESLQQQLSAAQVEQRKTTAALDSANKQAKEGAAQLEEAQARAEQLQTKLAAQAEELSKLQEERASQRILLPVGMEEELDAPMTRSPRSKAGEAAVTSSADGVSRGAFRPTAGGGPALLGGSNYTDYARAFAQGAPVTADGGGLRLGSGFSEAASAAAWGPGKADRLLGLANRGGAGAAPAGRVGGSATAVPGINPAAKPFVATKQRGGASTSAGMPTASEGGGASGGMHGMQRSGLNLASGHDGMHGVALMGSGAARQGGYGGMQPGPPLMSLGFFDSPGDVSGNGTVARGGSTKDALPQGGDLLGNDVLGQGGSGGGLAGAGRGNGAGPPLMQGVSSQMHPLSFMMSPSTQKPPPNIWARPPGASHYG